MAANLISVDTIAEFSSSSSSSLTRFATGKTNELRIHAPIAVTSGASCENSALQITLSIFLHIWQIRKEGTNYLPRKSLWEISGFLIDHLLSVL